MSSTHTNIAAGPPLSAVRATGLRTAGLMALLGAAGGVALVLLSLAIRTLGGTAQIRTTSGGEIETVFFAGVPAILAAGWTMQALRSLNLNARKWAISGLLAAGLAVVVALVQPAVGRMGMGVQLAWVLAAVEAFVAALWLADLFGCLTRPGLVVGLAANLWLLLLFMPFFQTKLPFLFPALLGLMLAMPLLIVALIDRARGSTGMAGWMVTGLIGLPVGLFASLQLLQIILPV